MTEGVDLVFPAGTTIPAGGYLVITASLAAFEAVYPGVAAIEWTGGGLNNGGDEIKLETAGGVEVDVVAYDDGSVDDLADVWPNEPDGDGASLELIDSTLDNADFNSWKVSAATGGSPGTANVLVDVTGPVVSSVAPVDGAVVPAGLIDVSGDVSDDLSGVDRVRVSLSRRDLGVIEYWNGSAWVTNWSWVIASLDGEGGFAVEDVPVASGGDYAFYVWAWDVEQNLTSWVANGGPRNFEVP